jgi:hypothetical protein
MKLPLLTCKIRKHDQIIDKIPFDFEFKNNTNGWITYKLEIIP